MTSLPVALELLPRFEPVLRGDDLVAEPLELLRR